MGRPYSNRVFAIRPSTKRFLMDSHFWDDISKERVQLVRRMQVDGASRPSLTLDAHDAGVLELACIVENDNLKRAVGVHLRRDQSLELLCGEILSIEQMPGFVRVLTSLGEMTCKLLVAADGSESLVRKFSGLSVATRDYECTGLVANFTVARAHQNVAYQWMGKDGVIAYLPLPGNLVSMVWSVTDELAHDIDEHVLCDLLAKRYDPLKISGLESAIGRFPLRRVLPQSVALGRVVLVGDAAHQFLPLAGQGLNVGLSDTAKLCFLIKQYGTTDPGSLSVVNRYRRARKEEIESLTWFTEAIHDIAVDGSELCHSFQDLGFASVRHSNILRRFFIDKAMG
ncbi:MAG: FAD-dependent monooxygenase, partial [Proteobacteria bacterium]|nr:FAD-dependent monooxygenase [Pseudomonadota bacterium]